MKFNKIVWTSVDADLSRTPPIYRPSLAVPLSGLFFETPLFPLEKVGRLVKWRIH